MKSLYKPKLYKKTIVEKLQLKISTKKQNDFSWDDIYSKEEKEIVKKTPLTREVNKMPKVKYVRILIEEFDFESFRDIKDLGELSE